MNTAEPSKGKIAVSFENDNYNIKHVSRIFTAALFLAVPAAAWYTGESFRDIMDGFERILFSPCPLITDYFALGSLGSAFLNAAMCGLACTVLIHLFKKDYFPTEWAGFFLVIAHAFYGLNFLNMWIPMLGVLLFCRLKHVKFRSKLGIAFFSTAFGPFVSELIFRYPIEHELNIRFGDVEVNLFGVGLAVLLGCFLGWAVPLVLPGAARLHRGFNLYNGGLAFGLLGFFLYSFLFRTMGIKMEDMLPVTNEVYARFGSSYFAFCTVFFALLFLFCLGVGWSMNRMSFKGYGKLLKDSGYKSDFIRAYGHAQTWINLGFYGLMILAYYIIVVVLTDGAGFTSPTCGVILAALSFSALGQHPRNVWPVLAGFASLSLLTTFIMTIAGRPVPWTLSTQGYLNAAAFATGLCPFTGKVGKKYGFAAGFICAVICTGTSSMHGGLMLYNGGLSAGLAALILLPFADHYRGDITG